MVVQYNLVYDSLPSREAAGRAIVMREQWRQHRDSLGCSVQRALAPDVRLKPLPAHRRPLVELDHMIQRFGAAREVGHVGVQCC